jgi:hypothetical protein
MRSPIGPALIVLGLATTVILALLLVQTIGLRDDLDAVRIEVADVRTEVATQEVGVTAAELRRELDELREWTLDWIVALERPAAPTDPSQPASSLRDARILDRLTLVLDRITALDNRVDEICANVPVC